MGNENVLDYNSYITQPFLGESANTFINLTSWQTCKAAASEGVK